MRTRFSCVGLILIALVASTVSTNSRTIMIGAHPFTVVSTLPELAAAIAHKPSGSFTLDSDYDASADGTYASSPIPTTFTGKLDGQGHTISNLSIHSTRRQGLTGLFAHIGIGGVVRNINLAGVSIAIQLNNVGALAGENEGTVTSVQVAGSIVSLGHGNAGGLVGLNSGSIIRSSASVTVSAAARSNAGGLVGLDSNGMVKGSHANGKVTAGRVSMAGGLVGNVSQGAILNSYATGQVYTSTGSETGLAGGLVGYNTGVITTSFATGSAYVACCGDEDQGYAEVGGLVGDNAGAVQNSYSSAAVAGSFGAIEKGARIDDCITVLGGLVGNNEGTIADAYSTGKVGDSNYSGGGFAGCDPKQMIATSYWDFDSSGVTNPSDGAGEWPPNDPGITGMTSAQFQSGLPAGFDPTVWGQNSGINGGFPYLLANPPP
jgi:hypothetical protein